VYLEHLAQAIAFRTVSHDDGDIDHDEFGGLHRFLAETYPLTWSTLARETVADHSLLFTWRGSDRALDPILLMAHLDVVPVESPEEWRMAPFSGDQADGHLYGRGALDDKGSVIALFETVEGLLTEGFRPTRTVLLAFGHDEESTGMEGAAGISRLLADRGVHLLLVLDEGGFVSEGTVPVTRRPVALIGIAEKGYMDLELTAVGEPGHSSYPPPSTAVGRVAASIARVEENPLPARIATQSAFFQAAAEAAAWYARPILAALPRLGRVAETALARDRTANALIRTTLAATVVSGGTKANVLPARARAVINARILPGDTTVDVLEHVRYLAAPGVDVRALAGFEPSPISDPGSEVFAMLSAIVTSVFPDAVAAPWITIGATDARYYARIADHVLRFSPFRVDRDEITGFHGPNERIRVDAGPAAMSFYRKVVETFGLDRRP
jgi:carboxypeptidase PM20D1